METQAGGRSEPDPRRGLLAGDVGGTKTVLALFAGAPETDQAVVERTYASRDYGDLESIIASFLAETDRPVVRASFAVAGPIAGARARVTNLPWEIDAQRIAGRFGLEQAVLINDLEAIARSIPHLSPLDLLTLHPGERDPHGPLAVIAPGTGLGEAYLTWNGTGYTTRPSEGGHADFAPNDGLQAELWAFLREEFGHVSVERVASGSGIPNIYRFLRDRRGTEETAKLAERLNDAADPTPLIVSAAVEKRSALCEETLRTFVSILGAEAGNLALKILATGGIYLAGGLPPRILPFLQDEGFLETVRAKGRLAPLLERIPVHVILNPRAALLGAAWHGIESLAA
jgi:glucokinase